MRDPPVRGCRREWPSASATASFAAVAAAGAADLQFKLLFLKIRAAREFQSSSPCDDNTAAEQGAVGVTVADCKSFRAGPRLFKLRLFRSGPNHLQTLTFGDGVLVSTSAGNEVRNVEKPPEMSKKVKLVEHVGVILHKRKSMTKLFAAAPF